MQTQHVLCDLHPPAQKKAGKKKNRIRPFLEPTNLTLVQLQLNSLTRSSFALLGNEPASFPFRRRPS